MEVNKLEGTVKWYSTKKRVGFILVDGQDDVHVSADNLPKGLTLYEGDKVSFDLVAGIRAGTTTATNVKVVKRAESVSEEKGKLEVDVRFGQPTKVGKQTHLAVWVILTRKNVPVPGVPVNLELGVGEPVDTPQATPLTNKRGEVYFKASFDEGAIDLTAFVHREAGQQPEPYSFTWSDSTVQVSVEHGAKLEPDEAPVLAIDDTKLGEGHYRFAFGLFNAKGQGVKGRLIFSPGLPLSYAIESKFETKSGMFEVDVPADGRFICEIKTKHPRTEVDLWVSGFNRKYQLVLVKTEVKHPSAKPGDGFFAHLTNGWK